MLLAGRQKVTHGGRSSQTPERADALVAALPAEAWVRWSAGAGSQGERLYDWVAVRLPFPTAEGQAQWLLARRSLSDPTQLAYYRAYGPAETELATLVQVAGQRWRRAGIWQQILDTFTHGSEIALT